MTVRPAVAADKFRVMRLLQDYHAAAGYDFEFSAPYRERLFKTYDQDPTALCLVYAPEEIAQGVLLARAFDHEFGPWRLAKETLWWIDPDHRGGWAFTHMLDAYEAWARAQGCTDVGMGGRGYDRRLAKVYERRGYRLLETHFLKAL